MDASAPTYPPISVDHTYTQSNKMKNIHKCSSQNEREREKKKIYLKNTKDQIYNLMDLECFITDHSTELQ